MIAFFYVSGNGSTREEVSRVSFSSENNDDNKKRKKNYDWSRNVVWGKRLNNKKILPPKRSKDQEQDDSKTRKKRRGESERERKKELRVDMERIWIYTLAFEESYLPNGNTHTHRERERRLERIYYKQ